MMPLGQYDYTISGGINMSFRPTISIYINGKIADIGYYRNWDEKGLFYEAIALAALYGDCWSIEEYRMRRFGRQHVQYSLEPEVFDNTEENLKSLESCSEFPIIVDITNQCIYKGTNALSWSELARIPSVFDPVRNYGYREEYVWVSGASSSRRFDFQNNSYTPPQFVVKYVPVPALGCISGQTDFDVLLSHCRMPFDHIDFAEVREIFQTWEEAPMYLSSKTLQLLRERAA